MKTVLTAAIARDAVGHAYLFSGPRGVGKTTTARLLAMAVNCEQGTDEAPCGECESCLLIRRGNHPDVTEIDAASNNSVDDIRELREQVRLASLRGGYRVWILDEAHMLSRSAANALLKTLEEPPPNLIFVLATTEPEKLLPTVLSRCQHFRFRRLTEDEIAGKLDLLCREAGTSAAPEALSLVARAADGAMRDAESMLERLLAAGTAIGRQDAEDALGLPPQDRLDGLARALAAGDVAAMLATAGALYRDGFAPRTLAEQLGRTLRDTLYRSVTGDEGFTLDLERNDHLRLLHALDDEQERFVRHDDLFALEAALVKSCNALFRNVPADAVADPTAATPAPSLPTHTAPSPRRAETPAAAPPKTASSTATSSGPLPAFDPHARVKPAPEPSTEAPPQPAPTETPTPDASTQDAPTQDARNQGAPPVERNREQRAESGTPFSWHRVKTKASAQLKAFLMPAEEDVMGDEVILRYTDTHRFHFQELKKRDAELATLVAEVGGAGYTIVVEGPGDTLRKKP